MRRSRRRWRSSLVVAIVAWRWRSTDPPGERTAVRWLGLGLAWTALALTFAAPGLAVVVAGLPNDHYHAFADPMVFVLVGLGAGARGEPPRDRGFVRHHPHSGRCRRSSPRSWSWP